MLRKRHYILGQIDRILLIEDEFLRKHTMYCTPKVGQLRKRQRGDIFQGVQQGGELCQGGNTRQNLRPGLFLSLYEGMYPRQNYVVDTTYPQTS